MSELLRPRSRLFRRFVKLLIVHAADGDVTLEPAEAAALADEYLRQLTDIGQVRPETVLKKLDLRDANAIMWLWVRRGGTAARLRENTGLRVPALSQSRRGAPPRVIRRGGRGVGRGRAAAR